MHDILVVLVHAIVTVVRLMKSRGPRAVVAESAVGIENQNLSEWWRPPAIVTEIVAEMITLALGNVRET